MTTVLEGGEWSVTRACRTLPPGKTPYPFYRRLVGTQGWSGRAQNLVPTGIFFGENCVFIGTYTLQSQKFYSCSLLVSLWYNLHNVTSSRDEPLREWEML